jgi:hypothetical protein
MTQDMLDTNICYYIGLISASKSNLHLPFLVVQLKQQRPNIGIKYRLNINIIFKRYESYFFNNLSLL